MTVFDRQRLVIGISVAVILLGVLLMVFARGDVLAFWTWDCSKRRAFEDRLKYPPIGPSPWPELDKARRDQIQDEIDRLCPQVGLGAQTLMDQLQCVSDRAPHCERTSPQPAAIGTSLVFLGMAGVIYGVSRKTW
jgi:hypothetical protein